MNATFSRTALAALEPCSVMAIYDTELMRTRAIAAQHYLLERCRENVDLEFLWWRTAFFADPLLARQAAHDARECDCLLLCLEQDPAASPALEAWFESWIVQRAAREGAMVDFPSSAARPSSPAREEFLQDLCRRGGLEWLVVQPRDSARSDSARFQWNTLVERPPYPHFGLNE